MSKYDITKRTTKNASELLLNFLWFQINVQFQEISSEFRNNNWEITSMLLAIYMDGYLQA